VPDKRVANLRAQARARSIATFAAIDQLPPAQTSSSREPGSAIAAVWPAAEYLRCAYSG
jgi:hypothetical protein